MTSGPPTKRGRHDDADNYPSPIQDNPADLEFETLGEKKQRTVRCLDICENNFVVMNKNIGKMHNAHNRQEAFMLLAKFATAMRVFAKKIHLQCPLLLDASIVSAAEVADLEDLLYLCATLSHRVRFSVHAKSMHCPKRQDDLFVTVIRPFKDDIAELALRLESASK